MKTHLLLIAMIALLAAGCRYNGPARMNNDGGLAFKDALSDFAIATAEQSGRGQSGRNLYPSDPSLRSDLPARSALIRETLVDGSVLETEVYDQFEFGPLMILVLMTRKISTKFVWRMLSKWR